MRKKITHNKMLSILLAFSFSIVFTFSAFAAESNPYSPINYDISKTWSDLQAGPLNVIFASRQTITTGMYLWQSELINIGTSELVSYSAITTDTEIAVPFIEIVLNPDRYDAGYELGRYSQEYFGTILPGIEVRRPIIQMMELILEAVDLRLMGYDGAQYVSTKVNEINLSVNLVKTTGDTYTVMAYLNLPDTALDNGKSFTIQSLMERLKYENLRRISYWFVYNELTTDPIKIDDEKWEVSWEVMSAVSGISTYELYVLDKSDNIIATINIDLEKNSMGSVILNGKGEYKLQAKVHFGNMYIYALRIPDNN